MISSEWKQVRRDRAFSKLMLLLIVLMTLATWNTKRQIDDKKDQVERQTEIVRSNDQSLIAQIDSLNNGLSDYSDSYTLPTNGVRLTYNNHRLTTLPFSPLTLIAIGQGDLYSNYKKVILYYDESYEMQSQELVSPIEQLFGQLDLAFVWTYLLPLMIILVSFNTLSVERETGRLPLIASQPLNIVQWLLVKLFVRFLTMFLIVLMASLFILLVFSAPIFQHFSQFAQLTTVLFLYSAFWFFLSFLINIAGYSSGKSLILLTSCWVLFVFIIPSAVNQLGKEIHPIPSRLEVANHHQQMYNAIEANLEQEMKNLYEMHPDWASEDPITKDLSNSTGWNIDYLAKQYMAQLKHQSKSESYEKLIDERNLWLGRVRLLSPAMVLQQGLSSLSGTSVYHYRGFLRQTQSYAQTYREQVFKGLFTNHAFTSEEIRQLPVFQFDASVIPVTIIGDSAVLLAYLIILTLVILLISKQKLKVK